MKIFYLAIWQALFLFLIFFANQSEANDDYVNREFGFKIRKLKNWSFVTGEEVRAGFSEITLKNPAHKESFLAAKPPLVSIIRKDIGPLLASSAVHVLAGDYQFFKDKSALEILEIINKAQALIFDNYTIVLPPTEKVFADVPGAFTIYEYDLAARNQLYKMRVVLRIIPRGDHYLQITSSWNTQSDKHTLLKISEIVDSLKFY